MSLLILEFTLGFTLGSFGVGLALEFDSFGLGNSDSFNGVIFERVTFGFFGSRLFGVFDTGGNIVFLALDENVHELQLRFNKFGIENDLFGVREAKGLGFDKLEWG